MKRLIKYIGEIKMRFFDKFLDFNMRRISINPTFWQVIYKGFICILLKSEVYRNPLRSFHNI
jgi:hypothetical protein